MAHCAIYVKGTDEIRYFIWDCVQDGRNFKGSNGSVTGVKEHLFGVKWTEDDVEVVQDKEKAVAGNVESRTPKFSKKVAELSEAKRYRGIVVSTKDDVDKVTRDAIAEKYPPHEESKVVRMKLSGDDVLWKEYQNFVSTLVEEGRKFKKGMVEKEQ